jgi:hypothetical protein
MTTQGKEALMDQLKDLVEICWEAAKAAKLDNLGPMIGPDGITVNTGRAQIFAMLLSATVPHKVESHVTNVLKRDKEDWE